MSTEVDDPQIEPDPQVAEWMSLAAPRVSEDDDALAERLVAMAVATTRRPEPELRSRARRRRGIAAVILAPVLVLGLAGAGVAATIDWSSFWRGTSTTSAWTDWAQHPDATIDYTLPGGGACELRLGQFVFSPDPNRPADVAADPRSLDAALDYVRTADLLADADVEGVIQENRADHNSAVDDSGNEVPFGYGTENYDADVEYDTAVSEAVQEAITAHLSTLGIPSTGLGYQGQRQCAGVAQ